MSFSLLNRPSIGTVLALALASCGTDSGGDPAPGTEQKAEIRYTEYGVPHIRANDYETLGFAQGYAQAKDNLCKIERGMLAFGGELSKHFGPDSAGSSLASTGNSLGNDLYFGGIRQSGVVEDLVAKPAPLGPRDEVRVMVRGYVDGFNEFLAGPHAFECSGAAWLRPMTEMDVYRRVYAVTTLMGQGLFLARGIISAEPPIGTSAARLENDGNEQALALSERLSDMPARPGSNAIGLGRDATSTGGGINVANPHLRWDGDLRWWQTQLTVPGKLDVSGGEMIGVPLVVMGHTASVAWSITTAEKTWHFTLFELTLADDSPTTYLVDGVPEPMQRRDVSVEVKRPDGTLETVTRAQWSTRYGPVLGAELGLPLPPWSAGGAGEPGHAYVAVDANAGNMRMLNTLFAFNHAHSADDILHAIRSTQGVPWWSVVAADAAGQALLSQIQVVPNVTDAHAERCNTELGQALFASARIAVLDGSRSDCALQNDDDALQAGTFGPGELEHPRMPVARTTDFVENSNDSHWLPSATIRITGMPQILGAEGSERELRTRGVISELEAGIALGGYTRQAMQDAVLSNRSYSADLAVDATVAMCRGFADGRVTASSGESVDVRAACEVLASWDHLMDKDSAGALLFARFWSRAFNAAEEAGASLWMVPFDAENPVHTPNTLDVSGPFVAPALADAVLELSSAGISVDAALGDSQYVVRNGNHIPLGGGTDSLAVINLLTTPFGSTDAVEPSNGSGYMHVVAFEGTACPDAVTLMTYSQSTEPSSPHHGDQTELYSEKHWVTGRFCEKDILASPTLETIELFRGAKNTMR